MIKNGFYSYGSKALDGVDGGDSGVMVLRDGEILGGTSFFYFIGTYRCCCGKWKGEITQQEHNLARPDHYPTARRVVTAGFTGTYTDEGAEFEATALVGKRSLRYHGGLRLLMGDRPSAILSLDMDQKGSALPADKAL
jgi:hypothetical protein